MKNLFKILNEGKIENLKYKEYKMNKNFVKFNLILDDYEHAKLSLEKYIDMFRTDRGTIDFENEKNYRTYTNMKEKLESFHDPDFLDDKLDTKRHYPKLFKYSPEVAKYMGVEPFHKSLMINISPNWKGQFGQNDLTDKLMIKSFKKTIESYLNEEFSGTKRFTKWKYCLECGSEGNFLHAHIVAEINPKLYKSMITHINKGNHKQQIIKYWNKNCSKGNQGLLKGKYAIQRILLNSEEILLDKLKYLHEANKEEGHQNLRDLNLVFGCF